LADIQKDISELLRKKYGAEVGFQSPEADGIKEGLPTEKKPVRIQFDLKPEELEAYLDEYVVKQTEAKEILATKICTHFQRVKLEEDEKEAIVGRIKNNIILIGPTGVGKTYLVRLIAKRIGVPFVKADATKFSETGYVGGDVEDLVRDLVAEANGNIELAQYGIIYIDEIDKIAASNAVIGPDVSRTGVQRNLLKLMEETEVDLKAPHDLASQMETVMQLQRTGKIERKKINTKNTLFIVSGAFTGLEEIIRKRISQRAIGFNADLPSKGDVRMDILKRVRPDDLVTYGFESEFVGRLPVVAVLEPLNADDLHRILKNPNSSVILSKKRDFEAYGITVDFEGPALRKMAEMAYGEGIGARGLVSIVEKVLLKFEKRLPSTSIKQFTVAEDTVDDPEARLSELLFRASIEEFQRAFERENGISLSFSDEALRLIAGRAAEEGTTPASACEKILGGYGYGLKLLGAKEFLVDEQAIRGPEEHLDKLIKERYARAQSVAPET
jgi:endopeptidase Clp ATP-binding regulatory subunit ClpX